MTTERDDDPVGRLHVVLVPGFAGFDALGSLEYYAGVSDAFNRWREATASTRLRDVVLHYFDNLPTAAVETRAERLRAYLATRIARGEIQGRDRVALVGHSTGGLDIRRMVYAAEREHQERIIPVDGGESAADGAGLRGERRTTVDVTQSDIAERVECLVFLSVPQWGTNIADWVRSHALVSRATVEGLHLAVEAARSPYVEHAMTGVLDRVWQLTCHPDLLLAVQDALRETTAPLDPPGPRADAQQAGATLRLWLQHAVDDFGAIDDLASVAPACSVSPAHYSPRQRRCEREYWIDHRIRTLSFATRGRRPFGFRPGRAVKQLSLLDPTTWPDRDLVVGAEAATDISYRLAYRACAGGPFALPPTHSAATDDDTDGLGSIEVWDNDGIVNTASMLWPDGPETRLVAGDHGDIIGHYVTRGSSTPGASGREHAAYDLLRSGTGFTDEAFDDVWRAVFDFCES